MITKIFIKLLKFNRIINLKIKKKTMIHWSVNFDKNTKFEGSNEVYNNSTILNSDIGYASYISSDCILVNTKIGRFCSIADNVKIIAGNHPTKEYISTHPLFYSKFSKGKLKFKVKEEFNEYSFADGSSRLVVIGNDVWIGSHSLIMNGVTIGDGAIIAAGSVVTKNVPSFSIVGGVPAKLIRYRFSKEEIENITTLKWWEKDFKWIEKNAYYFNSIDNIKKMLSKEV